MTMNAGSCTIAEISLRGIVSLEGSGLISELMEIDYQTLSDDYPTVPYVNQDTAPFSPYRKATMDDVNKAINQIRSIVNRKIAFYTVLANAIITHIQVNSEPNIQ